MLAINIYIFIYIMLCDTNKDVKMEIKKKPKKLVTFLVDPEIYFKFKEVAEKKGFSLTRLFVNFIKDFLKE